jgi:hypothetical protein
MGNGGISFNEGSSGLCIMLLFPSSFWPCRTGLGHIIIEAFRSSLRGIARARVQR